MREVGTAQREHFRRSVGKGAAERLQYTDWSATTGVCKVRYHETYQIQFSQTLGGVCQTDDSLVSQICAVGQTQSFESDKIRAAPVLEPCIGNGCTPCQIHSFDAAGRMGGDVVHRTISNVLAVT